MNLVTVNDVKIPEHLVGLLSLLEDLANQSLTQAQYLATAGQDVLEALPSDASLYPLQKQILLALSASELTSRHLTRACRGIADLQNSCIIVDTDDEDDE